MLDTPSSYIVFIDEAGDPGIKRYSTGDPRYEWFTVSAVVVRPRLEPLIVDWVREARDGQKGRQTAVLHYRDLTQGARQHVCEIIGSKPLRAFVLASHKTNMRQHYNARLSTDERASRFYNWCIRILLERVTEWAVGQSMSDYGERRPIELVFSQRGGHNYAKLRWYLFTKLQWQEDAGELYLGRPVSRGMLLDSRCTVTSTNQRAGLQLADVLASAFWQGANSGMPNYSTAPALALRRIIARPHNGAEKANFGLTLLPMPEQGQIPETDRPLFRAFGYQI
ncbi:DUF3800 domain-containing protein [Sphingomonas mali]|uniref:DUF3800 domain-containing protein n=1 Tax=Sphingomonas mali TaxID=40682 RepID=UPI000A07AE96|nr:DUF3800 domain-containing protein [Sphingomonas mali]